MSHPTPLECPHCGQPLHIPDATLTVQDRVAAPSIPAWTGLHRRPTQDTVLSAAPFRPYALGVATDTLATQEWREVTFEAPARPATTESDVLVPMAQAAVCGISAGTLILCSAVLFGTSWETGLLIGTGGALVTFTAVWWHLLNDSRALLRSVEHYVGREREGPDVEPERLVVTVTTKGHGNTREDLLEVGDRLENWGLPVDGVTLRALFRAVTSGAHQWSTRSLAEVPGLSETTATRLLRALHAAGFLAYRDEQPNHPKGQVLTAAGRALGRKLGVEVRAEVE